MTVYLGPISGKVVSTGSRPFLDLAPSLTAGALFVKRVEYDAQDLIRGQLSRVNIQRLMPNSFRQELTKEIGLPRYDVQDPRELPPELTTERWRCLNDHLESFPRLLPMEQILTAKLLLSLGFHSLVRVLIPEHPPAAMRSHEEFAQLAVIRAHAGSLDNGFEPSKYEIIALNAPQGHPARVEAAIALITAAARVVRNAELAVKWSKHAKQALSDSGFRNLGEFEHHLIMSRVYRATALAPYLRLAIPSNAKAMTEEMDLAEHHARHLLSISRTHEEGPAERNLSVARENLMIVLLGRAKEAIALGDLDLAEERSLEMVTYDQLDPVNFLELGDVLMLRKKTEEALEAFRQAALLGSPGIPRARYMMGRCFEDLGQKIAAAHCYRESLAVDPLAYSSAHQLYDLAKFSGWTEMANWARAQIEAIYNVVKGAPEQVFQTQVSSQSK